MCQTNNQAGSGSNCASKCKHQGTGRCAAARAAKSLLAGAQPLAVINVGEEVQPGCVLRQIEPGQVAEKADISTAD